VVVQAGTYSERVQVRRSGAAGSPITFRSQGPVIMGGFTINASYARIVGFDISTVSSAFPDGVGVFINGSNNEILNNSIHDTCNEGIWAYGGKARDSVMTSYNTIRGNRIIRAEMTGIMVEGRNSLVESNDISHTLQTVPGCSASNDADGIRYFGRGHTIRKNYVHDITLTESPSAHIDATQTWGPARNIIFEQNVFDIPNDIIPGATVGLGFTMESIDGQVDGLIIRNNVFINHYTGYGIDTQTGAGTLLNLTIVNNTFVRVDGYGSGGGGMGIWITGRVQNAIVKNNAFYDYGYDGDNYIRVTGGSGVVIGNNSITKTNGVAPTGSPYPHDLWMVDAQFVNPAARDFHLRRTSPLIDAGAALPDVTDDLDRVARPQRTRSDIGAYEYF